MKAKFKTLLSDKTKDFGLTSKAIDELTDLGVEGLAADASDADIEAKVNSLVPFAKAMQGEITRKSQKKSSTKTSTQTEEVNEEDETTTQNATLAALIEAQMKPFKEQLDKLTSENEALKAEKTRSERNALIADKARQLGIPDYLMKRVSFAEDADLDKELADYKQELVNNNLVSKDSSFETGKTEDAMKTEAKSWAESLPNK